MGQHGFHGAHAAEPEQDLLPSWFPRTMTAEITNDPRVSAQTIIEKRFAAFETLVVSAILLAGSSCTGLIELQADAHSMWSREYIATWLYVLVFSCNMFCVLVLTLQYYQAYRLMTAGSTGFETCKEYYMNPMVTELRHLAAKSFFYSIPIFCISLGLDLTRKLSLPKASPVFVACIAAAVAQVFVVGYHNWLFRVKYSKCKTYEAQQFANLRSMMSHQEGYLRYDVHSM